MTSQAGRTMKLLSLDGGGIRGLSELYILENLMAKIKIMNDLETEPLPCNYFDIICGTSTGGIIAIMLGRLRMPVSQCIKAYLEMSSEVFGKPQNVAHREKFSPKSLERVIKGVVKDTTGDENALLMERNTCKTFVCTLDTKTLGGSPVLLRSYETGSAPVHCKVWEAARATSAAPTFFPPIKFQDYSSGEFIDAGVGYNNPTKVLFKEAKSYYRLKGYATIQPTCIVSIGAGQKDLIQLSTAASLFWFKDRTGLSIAPVLGEIVTDCENTHDEVTLSCSEDGILDRYFRFNVPQGMQNIALDEWDKAADIRSYTDKYMRLNQTEVDMMRCVALLRLPSQGADLGAGEDVHRSRPLEQPLLRVTQGSQSFGNTTVTGGTSYQGNFVGRSAF